MRPREIFPIVFPLPAPLNFFQEEPEVVFAQCLLDGLAVEESQNLLPILLTLHGLKSYVCLMRVPHARQ